MRGARFDNDPLDSDATASHAILAGPTFDEWLDVAVITGSAA
jgi:hypothetical protein